MACSRPPRGARLGAALSAAVFVIVAVSCASPTQIVVEVFTDACPSSGKTEVVTSTGIAVGTPANIDTQRPASTHVGCESATGVGTLTIYPSGANDEEVALKVLGGVEVAPDRCEPPGYAGCIVSQRTVRFVPHTTQRVTVVLSLACLNRECPDGKTCDNGACVDPQAILADGGTTEDAERIESGAVDAVAVTDAMADGSNPSTCPGCKGDCTSGTCVVTCTDLAPCTGELCTPNMPCDISCKNASSCKSISCSTQDQSCKITVSATNGATGGIACRATGSGTCEVHCAAPQACDGPGMPVTVQAYSATIECKGTAACRLAVVSCDTIKSCALQCAPGGGPDFACNMLIKPTCLSGSNECMNF